MLAPKAFEASLNFSQVFNFVRSSPVAGRMESKSPGRDSSRRVRSSNAGSVLRVHLSGLAKLNRVPRACSASASFAHGKRMRPKITATKSPRSRPDRARATEADHPGCLALQRLRLGRVDDSSQLRCCRAMIPVLSAFPFPYRRLTMSSMLLYRKRHAKDPCNGLTLEHLRSLYYFFIRLTRKVEKT